MRTCAAGSEAFASDRSFIANKKTMERGTSFPCRSGGNT
jgi:hypothetical protein